MPISTSFQNSVVTELKRKFGAGTTIQSTTPVMGGDINQALHLTLNDGRDVFLKYNHTPLPNMFECEAKGLALLRESGALRVPEAYAVVAESGDHPAFILLEWIVSNPTHGEGVMRQFGRQLAQLHRQSADRFGLDHDNFIGSLVQENQPTQSWVKFYGEQRLDVQRRQIKQKALLPLKREQRLVNLVEQLHRFIGDEQTKPSLIHGDLWGGNYMVMGQEAVLIDPAVYFGCREVELAFTELFGGFPNPFYDGYNEVWPLPHDYADRKALYQLYPLLVHLNLFGEAYGSRVDRILKRYLG